MGPLNTRILCFRKFGQNASITSLRNPAKSCESFAGFRRRGVLLLKIGGCEHGNGGAAGARPGPERAAIAWRVKCSFPCHFAVPFLWIRREQEQEQEHARLSAQLLVFLRDPPQVFLRDLTGSYGFLRVLTSSYGFPREVLLSWTSGALGGWL